MNVNVRASSRPDANTGDGAQGAVFELKAAEETLRYSHLAEAAGLQPDFHSVGPGYWEVLEPVPTRRSLPNPTEV